ncbi:hypothetical protein ACOARS_13205, partial [Glaesserella parasuis]|uniref:hypothetical protein n=1 Tax=Glaesserella parasuis TaxID=738 RepID=UPI003B829D7E
ETLSLNIARAAVTAQTAMAEAVITQAGQFAPSAFQSGQNPAAAADPFEVGKTMTEVMTGLAAQSEKLFAAQADLFSRYMDLWGFASRRASGETVA